LEFLLTTIWNGLSYGLLLFMLSSGLTLIFSMMGVLNFAHASFYMLGAYFAYQISNWIGFWPALIIAPICVGILGSLIEKYALRRAHKYGHVAELLFTFGLTFLIEESVHLIWGRSAVDYRIPALLDFSLFNVFDTSYPAYKGFMMLVSIGMLLALYLFITKTRIGLIIQAALSKPEMVEALGHNVPMTFSLVFGGGVALAALAGVIGGNAFITEPGMAAAVGSIVFVVVVVGGLGSLIGAFIASLLIGFLQTVFVSLPTTFFDLGHFLGLPIIQSSGLGKLTLTELVPLLPYLLMVGILVFRPKGIMGTRES